MANDATQIRVAGTGAIWLAPLGTALPTDSTSPLNPAFRNLGYAKSGFTVTPTLKTTPVIGWQSSNILRLINVELSRKYGFDLQQSNMDTVALAWGGTVTAIAGTSIGTVVIATATGVLTISTAHGLVVGAPVQLTGVVNGTPLVSGVTYYVAAVPSATTLTLAATLGGAAITTSAAGTATGIAPASGAYVVKIPNVVTVMEYSLVIEWADGGNNQRIVLARIAVLSLPVIKGDRTVETSYPMEVQELMPATGDSAQIFGLDHAISGA